jgi:hypothetical protein
LFCQRFLGEGNMMLRWRIGAAAVLFFSSFAGAATFSVKPDSGVILLWQQKAAAWIVVKDTTPVIPSDSLYLEDQFTARLFLGKGCVVLCRGEMRATVGGTDTGLVIYLDQGQLFLKRDEKSELASIKIVLRGCSFVPVGTAASMKYTKQGEPSVAVLAGKVRMQSAKGDTCIVSSGMFGTYDPRAGGSFKQGTLRKEAVAALESWSGVALETAQAAGVVQTPAPAASSPAKADTAQKQQAASQTLGSGPQSPVSSSNEKK